MELNKTVMVKKVTVLAFLIITFTSNFAHPYRLNDATSFLTSPMMMSSLSRSKSSSSSGCCDSCICTRSIPPQCQCLDVGEDCHSACDKCLCTRSFPPQCRCSDITGFCYESCSSYT
ncbi:Bowman-Birk type proteinase inhibitor-like [Neltuma alba]|uniref:Bowman-Birk type proteinase inhibitor-like n=1 Tax=Neltuma alba TaxID=207710 RepID=UPI0010A3B407|nr:Bowman-Birk type proteinase inhibitor-like [Prosopis alba]XP_028756517.1 Bowman-Birk type proteinase inhibitor-like [Prosopis alba]